MLGTPSSGKTSLFVGLFRYLVEACRCGDEVQGIFRKRLIEVDRKYKRKLLDLFFLMAQNRHFSSTGELTNLEFLINPNAIARELAESTNSELIELRQAYAEINNPIRFRYIDCPGEAFTNPDKHPEIDMKKFLKDNLESVNQLVILIDIVKEDIAFITGQIQSIVDRLIDAEIENIKMPICWVASKKDKHDKGDNEFQAIMKEAGGAIIQIFVDNNVPYKYLTVSVGKELDGNRFKYEPQKLHRLLIWLSQVKKK